MKIYLAHSYAARYELRKVRKILEDLGHIVTSRWIGNEHEEGGVTDDAQMDYDDVKSADLLILFADEFGGRPGCGKFIEFGFAVALEKVIIVVEDADKTRTIFFSLPGVWKTNSKNWLELLKTISKFEYARA